MSCVSIASLIESCEKRGEAGVYDLYMVAYNDTAPVSSGTTENHTITGGMISDIGLASSKHFVRIGSLKESVGVSEEGVFNPSGSAYLNQTLVMSLNGLTLDIKAWVENVFHQRVVAMVKIANGKFFAVGLNGRLTLSGLAGGTGTAAGDNQGYQLTFTGTSSSLITQVDPTLVPELI